MTDWKFTGEIPPMSDAAWQLEFEKYKQSPEYKRLGCNCGHLFIYCLTFLCCYRFNGLLHGAQRLNFSCIFNFMILSDDASISMEHHLQEFGATELILQFASVFNNFPFN
jgi:hypothetical protein